MKKCLWPPFFGVLKLLKTLIILPNFLLTLCSFMAFYSTIRCMVWWTKKIGAHWLASSWVRGHLVVCYVKSKKAILKPTPTIMMQSLSNHFNGSGRSVESLWMFFQNSKLSFVGVGFIVAFHFGYFPSLHYNKNYLEQCNFMKLSLKCKGNKFVSWYHQLFIP